MAISVDNFIDLTDKFAEYIRAKPPVIPPRLPDTPVQAPPVVQNEKKKKKDRKSVVSVQPVASTGPPPDKYEMDKFFEQTLKIRQEILKIGTYRDQIEQAYRKALTSATESEVERMEEIIERIFATNNKVALEIKAMLGSLQADNERIKAIAEKGSGDIRMRVLQHASLTRQFANAMKGIQDAQKDFKEKHKQALIRNYLIVRPFATQLEIDQLTNSSGGLTLTSSQVFALATKGDIRQTLDEMKRRRSSVINIENSLKVIQQMFVDLETMIDEQGEMLNDIETNLNNAEDYIAEAVETLKESVQMQKRMHRRCTIF